MSALEIEGFRGATRWFCRDEYYFVAARSRGFSTSMRCINPRCRARWVLRNGVVGPVIGKHDHNTTPWVPSRNAMYQTLKRRCATEDTPLSVIYQEESLRYPDGAEQLPFFNVSASLRKWRRNPPHPSFLQEHTSVIYTNGTEDTDDVNEYQIVVLPPVDGETFSSQCQADDDKATEEAEIIAVESIPHQPMKRRIRNRKPMLSENGYRAKPGNRIRNRPPNLIRPKLEPGTMESTRVQSYNRESTKLELEVESKLADAALIISEAARTQAEAAKTMAEASHMQAQAFVDFLNYLKDSDKISVAI